MKRILFFASVAVFSIFLGSQITEAVLLVPYWKTLPLTDFYAYHDEFGPIVGRFYTVLTIIASLIAIGVCIYSYRNKSQGLKYAITSLFLMLLVIGSFYVYFKGANQSFYDAQHTAQELAQALNIWGIVHCSRVFVEILVLIFLIPALNMLTVESLKKRQET